MKNEHHLFTPGKKAGEIARRVTHTNVSFTHRHGVTVAKYATIDGKARKTKGNKKITRRPRYVYFCMAGISLCQLVNDSFDGGATSSVKDTRLCPPIYFYFFIFLSSRLVKRVGGQHLSKNDVCRVMSQENHFTVSVVLGHVLPRFLDRRVSRCSQCEIRLA